MDGFVQRKQSVDKTQKDTEMIMWLVVLIGACFAGGLVYLLMQKHFDHQLTHVSDLLKETQQQLIQFSDQYRIAQKILQGLKKEVEEKNLELLETVEENRKLSRETKDFSKEQSGLQDKCNLLQRDILQLESEKEELMERLTSMMHEFHQLKLSKEAMFKDLNQITDEYCSLKELYEQVQSKNNHSV